MTQTQLSVNISKTIANTTLSPPGHEGETEQVCALFCSLVQRQFPKDVVYWLKAMLPLAIMRLWA